jgi:excisionase family DNA binding protein
MEFLTAEEAAALLGVHPKTLDRWVRDGVLPVIQPVPRGQRRFRRSDVEALLTPKAS